LDKSRVIAFLMQKGGVGKTCSCVNIAAILGKQGFKVCVVDGDAQQNATTCLGVNPYSLERSLYDAIIEPAKYHFNDIVVKTEFENVDLVPSNEDLYSADIDLVSVYNREGRLKTFLKPALRQYNYILIDSPPALSLFTVNIMTATQEIFIVVQAHPLSYLGLGRLLDDIDQVKQHLNRDLKITGVILTMFEHGTKISQTIESRLGNDERIKDLMFKTAIRKNTTLSRASLADEEVVDGLPIFLGRPINYYDPRSRGAEDYQSLTEEITKMK